MKNEEIIVKKLSEKFNKKGKVICCMLQILKNEDYNIEEKEEIIEEFIGR